MDRSFLNDEKREYWKALIKDWVHNAKDREILEVYLLDSGTYEGTGEICAVSSGTVKKKIHKYVPIIRSHHIPKK